MTRRRTVRTSVLVGLVMTGAAACGSGGGVVATPSRAVTTSPATTTSAASSAPAVTLPPTPADWDVTRSPTSGPGVRCSTFTGSEPEFETRLSENPTDVPVILTATRPSPEWERVRQELERISRASFISFAYYERPEFRGLRPKDFELADSDGYRRWLLLFADDRTFSDPGHSLAVLLRGTEGVLPLRVMPASVPEVVRRYDYSYPENVGRMSMPGICDFAARAGRDLVYGN